ncbi:MAG: carbohydrate binding family 9 domain-containing protein [Flavobacteriaceae bacterium]|nr:carbohydrate binding family 9 domain-containing protein [Flavobacteriaceae bacterium]
MKRITINILVFVILISSYSFSQENEIQKKKIYNTVHTSSEVIIDGDLSDSVWDLVQWQGDFLQMMPTAGEKPTRGTNFKVLYDDDNIYIAIRCFDDNPDEIVKRLSRRDGSPGDWIKIDIDSYRDFRTAYSFGVNSAGVQHDNFMSKGGNSSDRNWNAIWKAKTKIHDKGWDIEVQIPFSQLRFNDKPEQVWGLQIARKDFRINEINTWSYVAADQPSMLVAMGELRGIKNIKPKRQVEIQPYVLAKLDSYKKEIGNPFMDGKDTGLSVGIDGKIGITNNLTLDFTINPDFGQVEADPSVVNLGGFQVFLEERRPFFIENRNIFDYQITQAEAGGRFNRDNLFYSRRIGGRPKGYPDVDDDAYVDIPNNTSILGATKFSGKTESGWSIGILETVTAEEIAKISLNGEQRNEVVEPLTNYFVGRTQKEFNNGDSFIGGIFTAVNRDIGSSYLADTMVGSAYTGGLDFRHSWDNRSWYVAGNAVFSSIEGSKEAIYESQTAFHRNFQRTDADYLEVDENKTKLTGNGGNIKIGKSGSGHFRLETGLTWRSPELELNDIGFMNSADEVDHYLWSSYQTLKPFSVFRSFRINYNHFFNWDYSGNLNNITFSPNMHFNTKSYWNFGTGMNFDIKNISNKVLRGGPSLIQANRQNNWLYISSNSTKNFTVGMNMFNAWDTEGSSEAHRLRLSFNYRVGSALELSFTPNYYIGRNNLQYIDTVEYNDNNLYINGRIKRKQFGLDIRINYTINPNLTVQYFGRPFYVKGEYDRFKYITNSMADEFQDRFYTYTDKQISYDEQGDTYMIDKDNDGQDDFELSNPNYSSVDFMSNLVIRYEYKPGSELYLVWSQGMSVDADYNKNTYNNISDSLFGNIKKSNTFLVKWTYRFIR